ncbi:MAG: ORF6N domain-containing protein [Kiritimatiellia bacterium]
MTQATSVVPYERIAGAIYLVRGQKVMLDRDLATLYGVETRVLSQAVKRNRERFPPDFMLDLSREEIMRISQSVISSPDLKYSKTVHAFTEQGVAMLSGILNSPQAVAVNIAIMRAFVRLREFLTSQATLAKRLRRLEQEVGSQGKAIGTLFDAIEQFTSEGVPAIGFQYVGGEDQDADGGNTVRETKARYRTTRKHRTQGKT